MSRATLKIRTEIKKNHQNVNFCLKYFLTAFPCWLDLKFIAYAGEYWYNGHETKTNMYLYNPSTQLMLRVLITN